MAATFSSHNFYTGVTPSVTVGAGVDLIIIVVYASDNSGLNSQLTSATLGGQSMTVANTTNGYPVTGAVCTLENPTQGSQTFTPTYDNAPTLGYTLDVYEYTDAESVSSITATTHGATFTNPETKTVTATGVTGAEYIVTGFVHDDNTVNVNSGSVGSGFTANYTINDDYRQVISGYVNSVPDASEPYDLIFDDSGLGGGNHNGFVTFGFVVDDKVADVTPPVFTAGPTAANATDSGHDIQATLDENGTIYAVRLADGASAPSSAQVKAGQDAASSPAPESKSVVATESVQASMTFSTASDNTPYDYYVVAEDDEGTPNIQASPTLVEATTLEILMTVDSISPTNPKPGDTVTINVSNANNASGKTVTYNGSSIAVSSQDINSLTINSWPYPWDLATPDVDFNTNYNVQVTDGGESDTIVAQTQPATGEDYFVITGKPWPNTSIYFDDPAALDNGDKHWGYWSTGGAGATVATNGVVSNVQNGYVYTYRLLDLTSGLWGTAATETFNIGEPAAVSLAITLIDSAENPLLSITGINWAWYDSVDAENLGPVIDSGVNENTNGSGLLEIDLPNTTLIAGQQGTLLVKDATGRTGFYNVTVQ